MVARFFVGAARTAQQYKSNIKKETGGLLLPIFAKWRNNQKTLVFNPRLLKTNLFSTSTRGMFLKKKMQSSMWNMPEIEPPGVPGLI